MDNARERVRVRMASQEELDSEEDGVLKLNSISSKVDRNMHILPCSEARQYLPTSNTELGNGQRKSGRKAEVVA